MIVAYIPIPGATLPPATSGLYGQYDKLRKINYSISLKNLFFIQHAMCQNTRISEETVDNAELVELSDHGEGEDKMLGVGDYDHNNMVISDSDCKSVIIGDSLVKHVDNVGSAAVLAKSGLQASQVDEMLRVAETKLDMDKVVKAVFHLGVNDLNRNKQNPDIVKLNLAEAIVKVESAF